MATATLEKKQEATSIKERVKMAAKRYLQYRDYEVLSTWESKDQFGFVAKDDHGIAFVQLVSNGIEQQGLSGAPAMSREDFEQVACKWFSKNASSGIVDMSVRFDVLSLKVLCADRALIRHHVNALGATFDLP